MQSRIKATDDATARRVEQALQFYLSGLEDQVERLDLAVQPVSDPLGNALHRCTIVAGLVHGGVLELEETQGDMLLAVNRILDRSVRTLRRRGPAGRVARLA